MHLEQLWLRDFRSYREAEFSPSQEGITVVSGGNGEGKTNLVEAIGYLATLQSLRASPPAALVRDGVDPPVAVIRAEGWREGRRTSVEVELHASGRDRVQVNGQRMQRSRDLLGAFQVTAFSPDDLFLVKGGPQQRRSYMDGLLVALHPRHDATIRELERVLKQRNALLKSAGTQVRGRHPGGPAAQLPEDVVSTLAVWDSKLASCGEALSAARTWLVGLLEPLVSRTEDELRGGRPAHGRRGLSMSYVPSWRGTLAESLEASRTEDLRRGVTTVGPHRDELAIDVGGMPARTHASQGEQRCLALALRLAGHHLVTERIGSPPVLVLDDVFSELDARRSDLLLSCLPEGQAVLTAAGEVPVSARVALRYRVEDGRLRR